MVELKRGDSCKCKFYTAIIQCKIVQIGEFGAKISVEDETGKVHTLVVDRQWLTLDRDK